MLVITDNDKDLAKNTAEALGAEFFNARGQMVSAGPSDVDKKLLEAKARVQNGEKGVQLTEWSDHSGCGFSTDGTELLLAMIERGMGDIAAGLMWDPLAVSLCHDAGEGTELMMRIGGKASVFSGKPMDLKVVIEKIVKGYTTKTWLGDVTLGDIAIVRSEALQLILVSERTLAGGPGLFRELGIEPESKDYLIFKYAHDSENSVEVFGTTLDYKSWPSDRISRPKYPWDPEPFV